MVLNPNRQSSRGPLLVERDVTRGVKHQWMGGEVKKTRNKEMETGPTELTKIHKTRKTSPLH